MRPAETTARKIVLAATRDRDRDDINRIKVNGDGTVIEKRRGRIVSVATGHRELDKSCGD